MLDRLRIIVIFLLLLATGSSVDAQTNFDFGSVFSIGGSNLPEITLEPQHPQPQEQVKLIINDYKGDYINYNVEWFENGEKIPDTDGAREIVVNSGEGGEVKKIKVVYTDTEKLIKKESVVEISPVYIDVILEPQTHVPDFYQGRALPTAGSIVNVTALVDNKIGDNNLIYTWKINNRSFSGISGGKGLNRTFFIMPNRNSILTLTVKTSYGKVVGRRVIFVKLAEPEILFYETNSLLGLLGHRTLDDTVFMKKNTITIQAEPFYLDSRVYNNPVYIGWFVDGKKAGTKNNPYRITLMENGIEAESGPDNSNNTKVRRNKTTNLSFFVRGDDEFIMQGADNKINIKL